MIEIVRISRYVRTRVAVCSCKSGQARLNVHGIAGLEGEDAIGLPATQDLVGNARPVRAERATLAKWQVIGVASHKTVTRVEGGQPAFGMEVKYVEHRAIPGRAVINSLGPRIA